MALTGEILGNEDVARPETSHGAVADLDVDGSGEREDGVAPGRVVPGVRARWREAADHHPAARQQLRRLRRFVLAGEAWLDVLEVRLAVRTGVDAEDGHHVLLEAASRGCGALSFPISAGHARPR